MKEEIILVELFSGIGGFAKGLMDAGIKIKEHYFSEIDKHAIANYKYNFPDAKYIGSVKDVRGIRIKPDIITFGWPCQDNSIAGKRKGQRHGTRSGLLFEAGRIIMELKPRHFIAENVKGLYSVNEGNDFYQSIRFLTYFDTDSPQYTVEMQLFNTDWFLPQNRERTYFVGHIGTECIKRVFPFGEDMPEVNELREQTTNTLTARYYGSQQGGGYIIEDKQLLINSGTVSGYEVAVEGDGVNYSFAKSKTRRGRVGKQKAQTLDRQCQQGVVQLNPSIESGGKQPYQQNRVYDSNGHSPALQAQMSSGTYAIKDGLFIRRFTEIECERLQGFPDDWTKFGNYENRLQLIPKAQRYKLIGNAVTTHCSKEIGKNLFPHESP